MKHDVLRSIAHNISDSLASGAGLLIGVYDMDIFAEAAASPQGFILVDFLEGTSSGGETSKSLAKAICLYRDALPRLCESHGALPSAFRQLIARYSDEAGLGPQFLVTIEDQAGRRSTDAYAGSPGRRVRSR